MEEKEVQGIANATNYCGNREKVNMKKCKNGLKKLIPFVVLVVVTIVIGNFLFGNDKNSENNIEDIPNVAIYLQTDQLKYSYLDTVNPKVICNGYPYKRINFGYLLHGKYYNTERYFVQNISFIDSDTIVYPLPKEDETIYDSKYEDNVQVQKFNLKDGSSSSYYIDSEETADSEKLYSPDGKHYYIIDTANSDIGVLTACKSKNAKTVFTINNVHSIEGIKQETGEIYYLKEIGSGKLELYKTTKGEETKIDYGITSFSKFYSTGEAYYYKGDDLYYTDGEYSKKIAKFGDNYFKSSSFALDTAVAAIANGNSLNIIVKDKVKTINCATNPHDIALSTDGKAVFYLDDVHESGFYIGKVKYHETNSMEVGDLYKISIDGSNISEPELYDTEVSKETVNIENDGAVSYYKNYMLLFSIVDLDYPVNLNIGDFYVNKKLIGEKVSFVEYVSQNEIYYICDVDNLKNVDKLVVKNEEDIENINWIYPTLIEIESPKNFTSGTLKKYNGKHSVTLANNVHEYYVKDNGQVLLLMNCNDEYLGELYLYDEKGNIFIDYDVTDIISVG